MRVIIRRVLQLADGIRDIEEGMRVLAAFGTATARLSSMIKIQALMLGTDDEDTQLSFKQALAQVWEEMKADGYNLSGKGLGGIRDGDGQAVEHD